MKKIFRHIPLVFSWLTLSPLFYDLSKRWGIGSKPVRIILLVVSPLFLSICFMIWCIKGNTDHGFIHSDNEKVSHTTKVESARENEKDSMSSYQKMIIPYIRKKERKWKGPGTFIYTFGDIDKGHENRLDTVIPYVSAKDSVWIKTLNQIPVDIDSSCTVTNLYFRMQLPEDIEIVVRYISSYGVLIASLYDHRTGKNYLYKEVTDWEFGKNDGPLLPPDSRFWHRNGDVHYFHYEWPEDPYAINDDAPFQLLDIDFDGKKELLVNGGDFCREGFAQIIYRLKGNRIVPADDLPFTYVRMSDTKLDPDKKRILLSSSDVWSYACFFLTKTDKPISIQKKPAFKTSHAKWLWNESDFSKNNNVFVLDSIYERDEIYDPYSDWDNRMDSCWEYKRVGKEMKLVKSRKMRHE